MDRYAVMGHPVAHSKSPFIHARFAEQTGERLTYEAICVAPGGFAEAVAAFRDAGGRGLNVTLPFKEEAFRLAQELTARAREAGAVNTLWFGAGGACGGDNTDGVGLRRDLEHNLGLRLAGARILLVGAGGAARGALGPLLEAGPRRLVVANRTPERAVALCRRFEGRGELAAVGFDALAGESFDLVVNATSASLHGELPPVPRSALAPGGACYDMMYAPAPTAFVRWGEQAGARLSVDGVGMLVEQAAESFVRWRGVRPETAGIIAAVRERLRSEAEKASADK